MTVGIFFIQCLVAVFVILDPFGNVPILMSLTPAMDDAGRRRVLIRASVTALVILLGFSITGQFIFHLFDVTIGAFRIAGGLLLFWISLTMLYGEHPRSKITREEKDRAAQTDDVAITPMGVPMMAGPGAIAAVISLMDQAPSTLYKSVVLVAIPLAVLGHYAFVRLGAPMMRVIGENGLRVLTRLMGLILAVMAVQFVLNGLHDALPQILGR